MQEAILSGCLWIPAEGRELVELRKQFTTKYLPLGDKAMVEVQSYIEADGYIGVPRQAGLQSIANRYEVIERRSMGTQVRWPRAVTPWESQVQFVEDMYRAALDYQDFMAYAATGKGKTVCSLEVARRLGRTVVVLVDQDRLMTQWAGEAKQHFGLRDQDIGFVQGPDCDYHGKKLVIAMVQSLSQRRYDDEFYDYFGTMIVDEAHVAGAPVYSQVLLQFSAMYRFGVSATPDRKDALKKLIYWNLGEVCAMLTEKHQRSRVYYLESDTVVSWYANKAKLQGRYITELSEDGRRNLLIVQAIKWLYESGRDILAVSDRIEQLCGLMSLCEAEGIPAEEMGLYARSRTVWRYEKNPKPERRPYFLEPGAEFTPVHLTPVSVPTKRQELQDVFENARILFATYAIFKKGVNCPRLSGGIECTPLSDAIQVHGRILRTQPDKLIPIWVTIRDPWSFRAEHQFQNRLKDYVASNAEVYEWKLDQGVRQEDVAELRADVKRHVALLKGQRIITAYDGGYTIPTLHTPSANVPPPVRPIARITRSRPASL